MGMVDVGEKPVVRREAEAAGKIALSSRTLGAIRQGKIKKGDPFLVAEMAGMHAAKQTHVLVPHCHPLILEVVALDFQMLGNGVEARCRVKAEAKTGVEMEALLGVSVALNTVWDMVKYLEKDELGQYPETVITDIRVLKKKKGT